MDPTEEKIYLNGLNLLYWKSYPKFFSFIKSLQEKNKNFSFKEIFQNLENKEKSKIDLEKEWLKLQKEKIDLIPLNSPSFPSLLKETSYPPLGIYLKGTIPKDSLSLAVVGTRKCTLYGKTVTEKIVKELVYYGFTIVSGLAYGIDTYAHKTTLENKGKTIAVLASGLNKITPVINRKLAFKIIENGALISEYPLNAPSLKSNFPLRNRIISGLSLGTLVIEANEKSGALITANFALEQNREVFAIPGSIFNKASVGTNNLIKKGAKLVNSIEDILEELRIDYSKIKNNFLFKDNLLTEKEKAIYEILKEEELTSLDKILEITNLKPNEAMISLTELELKGLIKEISPQKYIRIK